MAILSNRIIADVSRAYHREFGLRPFFVDLAGTVINASDPLSALAGLRRKRDYALQQSINIGEPYIFEPAPSIVSWVMGMEDRRMIHGGVIGGHVLSDGSPVGRAAVAEQLVARGLTGPKAHGLVGGLEVWPESRVREAAGFLDETFYQISGWRPELMQENRLKAQQQTQISQAIEDQRRHGREALYAFEKERVLLANIRAGDRNEARRILNEMLATIYLSSPRVVVLRARAIELMSCLTRAAIEDNPLLEPLIERNHAWTERLIRSRSFEELSQVLMDALDDFIDGIYLHGVNRRNMKVRRALDFIGANFMKKISLQRVADEVELSPCRVSHLVKAFTGRTVLQVVQEVRVRHAQHLLERTPKSCADIAYDCGFSDQSYFIKNFRRVTGTTPAKYRQARGGH